MNSRRKPRKRAESHSIDSVVALLRLLAVLKLEGEEIAFRGQSQPWPLVPEIGRGPFLSQGKGFDQWIHFEDDLLSHFKKYAHPFMARQPVSDWDWLYIARHHGLPTRLLDWSTNPLKGLFFAVENFHYDNVDSVLWVIEATGWMETLDGEKRKTLRDMVLVFPPHINERIVAQDGCFTVFPLPEAHRGFVPVDKTRLVKRTVEIVIPASSRGRLRRELSVLGITHRSMIPGLDGLTRSIRQVYGEGWLEEDS